MPRARAAISPVSCTEPTTTPVAEPSARRTTAAARMSSPPPARGSRIQASSCPLAARAASRSEVSRDFTGPAAADATSTTGTGSGRPSAPGASRYTSTSVSRWSVTDPATASRSTRRSEVPRSAVPRIRARRAVSSRHLPLPVVVVVARDPLGRIQHLVHRRVEPAVDAVEDELAAHQQHEHRGDERHGEEHEDQLRAEPRERQPALPLDQHLDDAAGEDEHQRHQHREVDDRQRVEDELAQEVRRELAGPVQQQHHAGERQHEGENPEEHLQRVVAEGRAGDGRAAGAGPAGRDAEGDAGLVAMCRPPATG